MKNKIVNLIKRAIKPKTKAGKNTALPASARVFSRNEHNISRKMVSDNALKVLYRLDKAEFGAFLVGGSVRDLLLGHEPKDFDIATDAHPEQVKKLFRNCRLIGKRFRLAHVFFKKDLYGTIRLV